MLENTALNESASIDSHIAVTVNYPNDPAFDKAKFVELRNF